MYANLGLLLLPAPIFLKRLNAVHVENCNTHGSSYFLEFKDHVNDQFVRTEMGTPHGTTHLISTCDGILLLSSFSGIFVANPIFKRGLRIPPLPIPQPLIMVRHQCTISRVPLTSKFKLFFLHVFVISASFWYVFYVLRIGIDNSWNEIARKEVPIQENFSLQIVYSGGNDEVIVIDVDKEIVVREYSFPSMAILQLESFLWMENRLCCIANKDLYTTCQIYILDFDTGKWSHYHEMGPFDFVAACGRELNIFYVKFRLWINDEIILQVSLLERGREHIHFGYNVKNKHLTKIEGITVGNFEVWPHVNSLVSFPSAPT